MPCFLFATTTSNSIDRDGAWSSAKPEGTFPLHPKVLDFGLATLDIDGSGHAHPALPIEGFEDCKLFGRTGAKPKLPQEGKRSVPLCVGQSVLGNAIYRWNDARGQPGSRWFAGRRWARALGRDEMGLRHALRVGWMTTGGLDSGTERVSPHWAGSATGTSEAIKTPSAEDVVT